MNQPCTCTLSSVPSRSISASRWDFRRLPRAVKTPLLSKLSLLVLVLQSLGNKYYGISLSSLLQAKYFASRSIFELPSPNPYVGAGPKKLHKQIEEVDSLPVEHLSSLSLFSLLSPPSPLSSLSSLFSLYVARLMMQLGWCGGSGMMAPNCDNWPIPDHRGPQKKKKKREKLGRNGEGIGEN